jgi:hypothetical protein
VKNEPIGSPDARAYVQSRERSKRHGADLGGARGGEKPICEVRYLYASDDHQLYQPVFVRTRDDKPAKQCVRGQLLMTCRAVVV